MPLKARPRKKSPAARKRPASRPTRTKSVEPDHSDCPHCRGGAQTYGFLHRLYKFDVDRAREIVLDGREALELEPDDVRFSVEGCRIHPQHLDHVDPKYPGIIAHYWYPMPDGTVAQGHVLIDGNHRAARCLRDGLPYFVHILSEAESREVTLRAPDVEAILAQARKDQQRQPEPQRRSRRVRQKA